MKQFVTIAVGCLLLTLAACSRRDRQITREHAREGVSSAEQSLDRAWDRIAQGGEDAVDAGEYALERTREGAIRAFHTTRRVAGEAGEDVSDAIVLASIKARLAADSDTDALDINVDFADGVATLRGTVRSPAEAREAVRIALDTRGVDEVVSTLAW